MFALESLERIVKKRKRVGRGGARGQKSGRGSKGQLSRSGGRAEIAPFFEGGQMSLTRRLPRRGFYNRNKRMFELVSLDKVSRFFKQGEVVDRESLLKKKLIKGKSGHLVKILGPGVKIEKIDFVVDAISQSARMAVEGAGGTVSFPSSKGQK